MKHTLRQEIESILRRLNERCDMLERHIKGYEDNKDYQNAMINQIKLDQFKMVKEDLERALSGY